MNIIISYIFTIFLDIALGDLLLTRKRNYKYNFCLFIINFAIFLFGYIISNLFLKNTDFYQYVPNVLGFTFCIYFILAYKESIPKKIFTMFTIRLFSVIILGISSYILSFAPIEDFNLYKNLSILLRNLIQLMFIPIINWNFKRTYKEVLKFVSNTLTNIITFYSVTIYFFLVNYYQYNAFDKTYSNGMLSNILFVFIIVLSYIIIFAAISSINKNIQLEYNLKIVDTQVKLQKENYRNLNESIEDYFAFKHDTRHHLLVIKSMMDAKNYISASNYLDKFYENSMCQNVDVLCNNFTVDSILKHYKDIAINNGIDFTVNVNIPDNINIDNFDLAVVIGNCIENAIEACNKIDFITLKYIKIKAEIKGSQLVIKIKNSFNGEIIKEDSIIKTSKSGEDHGIGLCNVANITEKYSGYFHINYNDNKFEVHIAMNF